MAGRIRLRHVQPRHSQIPAVHTAQPGLLRPLEFLQRDSGTTSTYNSLGRSQSNNYTDTFQLQFSATKVTGSHTIKAGFDIRQINYELQNTGDILAFNGYTGWTQKVWNQSRMPPAATATRRSCWACRSGSSNYPLFPWWKQYYYAPYVQDDWKVSRRLTLNLGLRWDFNAPQFEKWNRMNGPFDPTVASPIASQVAANVASIRAAGTAIPAALTGITTTWRT